MRILVVDPIAEEGIKALRAEAEVDVRLGLKPDELVALIGDYEGLVVRGETWVSSEVIEAGTRLQVIGRAGIGVDNIDLEAATRRGIVVVNAPAGNVVSTAEHTLALLLALARHIPQANARLKSGEWQRQKFMGTELRHKTLGIFGLGRVGSEVARRAQGLEMRVVAHDPFVSVDHARFLGVELVSKKELLKRADFITIHIPLTAATWGYIGAEELTRVKRGAMIVNTARGDIVDEEALVKAVEKGRVAGAAFDVFSHEPARESPLFHSDKIIVTPHLGASTREAQRSVAVDVAEQVLTVLKGHPARYAVNAPLMAPDAMSVLGPFIDVCLCIGRLSSQLVSGQLDSITVNYEGEIADYDTTVLKAAVLGGILEPITEERVNLINANVIAQSRGLKVVEQKRVVCENYANLVAVEITTSEATTTVAGTHMRGETHIVRIDDYWLDIVPSAGYWLFSDHLDRPGLIGAVGNITGRAGINISSMLVARLKPRGQALMLLRLDEALAPEHIQQLLAIPGVYSAKVVKL